MTYSTLYCLHQNLHGQIKTMITISKNFLSRRTRLLRKEWLARKYSQSDKDEDPEERERRLNREKGSKPKKESVQEESYFHKEEVEQLKELKKKLQKDTERDGKTDKQ